MEYIIKDINGTEHGPVDMDTLKKWIDEDRVTKNTPVRQKIIALWKTAADFEGLRENLAAQEDRLEKKDGVAKSIDAVSSLKSIFKHKPKEKTSFSHKHEPENAAVGSRVWAFVFDLLFLTIVLFLPIFAYCNHSAMKTATAETDSSITELPAECNLIPEAERKKSVPATVENTTPPPVPASSQPPPVPTAATAPAAGGQAAPTAATPAAEPKPKFDPLKKLGQIFALPKMPLDYLKAETAPCTVADEDGGYSRGSIWVNPHSAKTYVCLSAKSKDAKWIEVKKLRRIYTWGALFALPLVLIYFGATLGYYAQTFGMWFWGIFITRPNLSEVYFLRSFLFTVLMVVFGVISPLMVYIFGRGLHDLLAGVRVINVAGKKPD